MKVAEIMRADLKTINVDATVMTSWAATAHPDEDVRKVARRMQERMQEKKVQRLFVEEHGALVSVISQSDIVAAVAATRV